MYGECVVAIHIPPINSIAQVTFKVVDGTEPTLAMPMLVANAHRLVYRGEDTMLNTAAGEVVPLVRCLSPENVKRRTTPASTTTKVLR